MEEVELKELATHALPVTWHGGVALKAALAFVG